jgi:hypothetical protein
MNSNEYVQYGCGLSAPAQWRNFDASPTLRFERLPIVGRLYTKNGCRFPSNVEYGDIVKGLPVPASSCRAVYCSHVLEHLALDDFRTALHNTMTLLRPGGTFRLVLPDLEHYARQYLENHSDNAALEFMRKTYFGYQSRTRSFKGFAVAWLGTSRHLWMWDYRSIKSELENVGFNGVRRACFGDSSDPVFAAVEDRDRWEDCLGVECTKPA